MNKQKFIEFLNNPSELKQNNLTELDDLVVENPYFQAARALEAKGNRLLKTRLAGKKTASAAVYSTNRLLLKKYLKGVDTIEKTAKSSTTKEVRNDSTPTPPSPTTETKVEIREESFESSEIINSPGSSSIDQLIYNLKQDMKELEKSRAKYIEVARKIEEEEAVENAVKRATGNTKSSATSTGPKKSTSSASKVTGSSQSAGKKGTTPKKTETPKKTTTGKSGTPKAASKTTTTKAKSATAKKASTTKKASTGKTTRKAAPKKAASKKTTAPKKTAARSTAKKSSARTSKTSKASSTKSKKDDGDGKQQQELIDQFIRNNPSFRPGHETKNIDDLSAGSTILPEDIGSEYLAEIFLSQGKKEQAIKIYNSLMLRFPEKKAYFAGRIKKIK